ncbi:AAA family ATPase [Candidatus Babeliales bacterium]|nr:AAA family ATPase [Candidatus Babeliales bacterium]
MKNRILFLIFLIIFSKFNLSKSANNEFDLNDFFQNLDIHMRDGSNALRDYAKDCSNDCEKLKEQIAQERDPIKKRILEEKLRNKQQSDREIIDFAKELYRSGFNMIGQTWHQLKIGEQQEKHDIIKNAMNNETSLEKFKLFMTADNLKRIALLTGLTGVGLGGGTIGLYYLFRTTSRYVESKIGRPTLVRESSRSGISSSLKKFWNQSLLGKFPEEEKLSDVILPDDMQEKMNLLAQDVQSTFDNGLPYRHALFYGLPGTGKTMFAKRLAKNSGMDYAIMSGADFAQFKNGESITELHKLFDWAEHSKRGLLIFIDEADSFLRDRRALVNNEERNLLNAFLSRTGTGSDKYMLVFASNYEDELDPAVLSRINKKINFPLPAQEERRKILDLYLNKYIENDIRIIKKNGQRIELHINIPGNINEDYLNDVAKRLDGFSGRSIEQLVSELRISAYNKGNGILLKEVFEDVVKEKIEEYKHDKKCTEFQRERYKKIIGDQQVSMAA